jgi:orotidine-5'-phosphate decarboxylase
MEMLQAKWAEGKFVCVGLDSEVKKLPKGNYYVLLKEENIEDLGGQLAFNCAIIDATRDLVCAYKPNFAFYAAQGPRGLWNLYYTILYIRTTAPSVPIILDAKVADIGNTNSGYVQMAFDYLQADAITVHPYLGAEALKPFLERTDKGIIVLCRTSNPGAGEFQDEKVAGEKVPGCMPLYKYVAHRVAHYWDKGNCALVVGATYPDELREVRRIVGNMPILIPGIGAQGGDVEKTVKDGRDNNGQGMIINSSRGIIFASNGADFAEVARRETLKLHNLINQYR